MSGTIDFSLMVLQCSQQSLDFGDALVCIAGAQLQSQFLLLPEGVADIGV